MPAKPGYRLYGGSPGEVVASVLTVAGISVLGPTVTGTVQPRSSAGGSVITDLLNEAGAPITSVPITAGSFLSVFQAPAGTPVYVPGVGGAWLKLTPVDLLDVVSQIASPTVESLGGTTELGKRLMAPVNAADARDALGVGPGLPSGGTTGQVLTKQSDGSVSYATPAAAPGEIAAADAASSTSGTTGSASGRRLWAAFITHYATVSRHWPIYWTGTAWPSRAGSLPAGWPGFAIWISDNDATAPVPPEMIDGDDLQDRVAT